MRSDLFLWKCSIACNDNLQKTLNTVRLDGTDDRLDCLLASWPLSNHFGTCFSPETIDILIQIPTPKHEHKAPLPSVLNLLKDRRQFNDKFPDTSLSTLGNPARFSKIQDTDAHKIVWSRPPDADATVPVTLYHPIFRRFIDDCKNHQPIDKDNKLVRELTAAMSEFFP